MKYKVSFTIVIKNTDPEADRMYINDKIIEICTANGSIGNIEIEEEIIETTIKFPNNFEKAEFKNILKRIVLDKELCYIERMKINNTLIDIEKN